MKAPGFDSDPAAAIRHFVETFVADSPENRLHRLDNTAIFGPPLVDFASGDDTLFQRYKELIGPFHLTPRELLEASLSADADPHLSLERVSVICWVLPIAKSVRAANARCRTEPAPAWSDTKYDGERFNNTLRAAVVSFLEENGCFAVAPSLSPLFRLCIDERVGWTSNWSERHALFAAGLGTFSLSDGFITPRGIAMRCGSVVVDLDLPPAARRYRSFTQNCPFFIDRSCGACIRRCPAGAVTAEGHDKSRCFAYLNETLAHTGERYGSNPLACGLCQTRVPCESRIPASV